MIFFKKQIFNTKMTILWKHREYIVCHRAREGHAIILTNLVNQLALHIAPRYFFFERTTHYLSVRSFFLNDTRYHLNKLFENTFENAPGLY
jgi:hypothetical protein